MLYLSGMKTIEELLNQEPMFLDLFEDGKSQIASEFDYPIEELNKLHFIYAWYDCQSYSGDAYLLFIKDDKVYEIVAGHCSCYGLEGQFEPEEIPLEVLYHRLENKLYNHHHLINVL